MDSDRKHLTAVLRRAVRHRGSALVEIYQNCPIFNDGAFDVLKDRDEAQARLVPLEDGAPIRFGPAWPVEDGGDGLGSRGVVRRADGHLAVLDVADLLAPGGAGLDALVVHDAGSLDPSVQFALSRLDEPTMAHVPVGVFREVKRPTYDDLARAQVSSAVEAAGGPASDDDLARLLAGKDTWRV
jgi:2-oxoglutarate ferredoxin oxidoreductase subunit beta